MTTPSILSCTKSEQVQFFSDEYDFFADIQSEPTIINVHHVWEQYIPDSTGVEVKYTHMKPVENVCIFSKEQALREMIRLHEKYETTRDQPQQYDINFGLQYGKYISYPISSL